MYRWRRVRWSHALRVTHVSRSDLVSDAETLARTAFMEPIGHLMRFAPDDVALASSWGTGHRVYVHDDSRIEPRLPFAS